MPSLNLKGRNNTENEDIVMASYRRAEKLLQTNAGKIKLALNISVVPSWIENGDCFWYKHEARSGIEFRIVNAATQVNERAFDHAAFAHSLSDKASQHVSEDNLPLSEVELNFGDNSILFVAFNARWRYDVNTQQCQKCEEDAKGWNWKISPDGAKAVFVKDHNLWIQDLVTGEDKALTRDGDTHYVYAQLPTALGNSADQMPLLDLIWSPDSSRILTHVIDSQNIEHGMPLVQHVPSDGSLRPTIFRPERRTALLNDDNTEGWQFISINVQTSELRIINYPPCPIRYPYYRGYFKANCGWWCANSQSVYLIVNNKDGTGTRLMACNTVTGEATVLFEEMPDSQATIIPATHAGALVKHLPDSNELVWFSERSGWGHLYLIDLATGQVKNAITSGEWLVRNILHFDSQQRTLIIQTAGRVKHRNPYYRDICRINIDTGKLITLIESDHDYEVADKHLVQFMMNEKASGVSSSGRYLVTTRSRVDETPETLLLDVEGLTADESTKKNTGSTTLVKADISALPQPWQWPKPIKVRSASDDVDIYGVVFYPSTFDAQKSYPVLDLSFTYLEPVRSFCASYLYSMAYAELGFIVVRFNQRGDGLTRGAGLRDKAFNDFKDTSVPFHNVADCAAGIQQLCDRYPYMDSSRVGAVDLGTVPHALSAMLVHPETYKVGISQNPIAHTSFFPIDLGDVNDFPSYEQFADNLKGKLLLMHGMLDDVMPVSGTLRIADALQKANKRFDMLLLPNVGHMGCDYMRQRGWDYLVTHLLGENPPEGF